MGTVRGAVAPELWEGVVRAALGGGRRPVAVERLRGGSKKGVYRLRLDDGSGVVVYRWADAENYWPGAGDGPGAGNGETGGERDPLSPASGLALFEAAHRRLAALGVRTPRLYLADGGRTLHPADLAVVEDVPGENLETLLGRDPRAAEPVLARLADALGLLREHRAPYLGRTAPSGAGAVPTSRSSERLVIDRALADLAEGAARDARLAAAEEQLAALVQAHGAAVRPRAEYGLVHGELGPDHVLVDRHGHPVLIDIEGLMHFDVEWEHAFLRIRFGEHYRWLAHDGLDEQRLALHTLAMRLALVAGPLRLLDGDFPDRGAMRGIAEHNLRAALALLR
ncbi:phosphotransferase [Kitasatospora indigofera]|uniref:phosphotransferase n=1 Tax=Kitasatospora indigofera TaxID=67307 RepID=UPI0036A23D64